MNFQEFLEAQDTVYRSFGDKNRIRGHGLLPTVTKRCGSYMVAFRYPVDIKSRVADLSERTSRVIQCVRYYPDDVHTTLINHDARDDFFPNGNVLDRLSESVVSLRGKIRPPNIDFRNWVYNQDTIIASGFPEEMFFEVARTLVERGRKNGLDLRLPWGAHITTVRFLENPEPENLEELFGLVDSTPPLGISQPIAIDIGYASLSPEGFEYHVTKRVLF